MERRENPLLWTIYLQKLCRIDNLFCNNINNNLEHALMEISAGSKYYDACGFVVHIVHENDEAKNAYCMLSSEGHFYKKDGRYNLHKSSRDLVALIEESPSEDSLREINLAAAKIEEAISILKEDLRWSYFVLNFKQVKSNFMEAFDMIIMYSRLIVLTSRKLKK